MQMIPLQAFPSMEQYQVWFGGCACAACVASACEWTPSGSMAHATHPVGRSITLCVRALSNQEGVAEALVPQRSQRLAEISAACFAVIASEGDPVAHHESGRGTRRERAHLLRVTVNVGRQREHLCLPGAFPNSPLPVAASAVVLREKRQRFRGRWSATRTSRIMWVATWAIVTCGCSACLRMLM